MRRLLHVLTQTDQPLTTEIIRLQRQEPGWEVEVVELFQSQPDYEGLLEKIFVADSVQVW